MFRALPLPWAEVSVCWTSSQRSRNDMSLKLNTEGLKVLWLMCASGLCYLRNPEVEKPPFSYLAFSEKPAFEAAACSSWGSDTSRFVGFAPEHVPQEPPFIPRSWQAFFSSSKWQPKFSVESESLPLAPLQHSWLGEQGFGMSENRRGEGKRCVCDCECLYVKAALSGRTQGNLASSDCFLLIDSWFLTCVFCFLFFWVV